jgi:hypothetical protein
MCPICIANSLRVFVTGALVIIAAKQNKNKINKINKIKNNKKN